MPKSKHGSKKKKRHYQPKHFDPVGFPAFINRDDDLNQEFKERLLSKTVLSDTDAILGWNIVPEKMSEILLDYAEPLINEETTKECINEMEKILTAAMMSWNYAIIKRMKPLKFLLRIKMSLITKMFFYEIGKRNLYSLMVKRKRKLYPDNVRLIVSIDVSWDDEIDGPHVVVLSAFPE